MSLSTATQGTMAGVKRSRVEAGVEKQRNVLASTTPLATTVEITHGMTSEAAGIYEREHSVLIDSIHDTDALLNSHAFRHKTRRFLFPCVPGAQISGPVEVGVVRLVANDGETLVFTSDAITPLRVPADVGRKSICMGDVVLFQRLREGRTGEGMTEVCEEGNMGMELGGSNVSLIPGIVELLTLDPSALLEAEDWCHAASWNAVAAATWVEKVVSCPPGLAQLSCILSSILGGVGGNPSGRTCVGLEGWYRSLQLPLLLRRLKSLPQIDVSKILHFKRTIFSVLRLYVAILGNTDSILPLPHVLEEIVYQFLSSPLFVDGLSVVLPQMADAVSQSSWVAAQQTLLNALRLGLRYIQGDFLFTATVMSVGRELQRQEERRLRVECALSTVLHRITSIWLSESEAASTSSSSSGTALVLQLVEEMRRSGIFRHFIQLVRRKERMAESLDLFDKAHRPPTLQDIRELHGLHKTAVEEAMRAMTQTYTPYLRHESTRFIENALLAAYAELYGPAARAVHDFMKASPSPMCSRKEPEGQPIQRVEVDIHVLRVEQPRIQSSLNLCTMEEVRLNAMFGLPLTVMLYAHREANAFVHLRNVASTFGYILVRLSDQVFVFPVLVCGSTITGAAASCESREVFDDKYTVYGATMYVLSDKDMLPSVLDASAVSGKTSTSVTGEPLPEAFFFYKDLDTQAGSTLCSRGDPLGCSQRRLFPPGTPAVSYILYILHVRSLRTRLEVEEGNVAVPCVGHARGSLGTGSALPRTLLWWTNAGNCGDNVVVPGAGSFEAGSGGTTITGGSCGGWSDVFAQTVSLPGEADQLRRSLDDLSASATLTPPQVECVHTLTALGSGVRALEGAVGSGKTTIIHAASLVRGRVNEALRKEHTPSWHDLIKQSNQSLSSSVSELAGVEELDDLFRADRSSATRDLLEEITNGVVALIEEHVLLSRKLRSCHAPLLLRPRAAMHGPPSQTLCVLGGNVRECEYCPLGSVMQKSYQRSLKAPLAATLNDWLSELHRLGNIVNVLRDVTGRAEEGEWMLFVELLPWIMSTKERNDTISAAMNCGKTWKSFLAEDIWDKESVRDSGAIVDGIYSSESSWGKTATWKNMEPVPGDAFRAVTLPNAARSLCDYGRSEAQGWRAVFGEKQNDLLNFLQHRIMEEAQIIYLFFLDLVHAVAATSEVSRVTVLTATRVTVLEELPLLHVWQPHYLMVDDYDQVEDWAYLTLSPTSVAVLSHQAEPPLRQEQQLAVTVLKALQKELHGTKFSTAAVLTSSLRFKRAELNKAVFLCRNNSPLTVYAPSRCPMQVTGTSTANTNGSYNVATSAVSGEAVANSDGEENSDHRGQPGFSSPSCVELWTHAVTSSVSPSCDGLAAAFVSDRITSVESSLRFSVYCGSALEREAIKEGISLHYANKKDRTGDAIALLESVFVLSAIPDAFVEHDEECDIAILCLSGISGLHRSVGDVERRQQLEQLADDQLFVERVEWWLWRAASRARSGFLLVGSRELFHFLQPLQRLERFVLQERERHGYWLPAEVSGAVLALRCPSHASCRQLAMITYADYCGCKVRLIGIQECRSLCLSPYDDCTNPAHACLHACHVPSGLSHICECGPECVANSLHRQCPFPCARTQPCGHVCLRRCSEPCVPCEFIGLQQLTCGQRVVTGVSDSGPTLALMRHFQQVPCGGTPRPCEEIVKVRCPRCGEKISMPCCQLTRRGGFDGIALSEAECAGCVALYNRVAVEFGGREMAVVVSTSDEEGGGASLLPVEELPEAAQEKLRKLRTVAMKKAQLMLQKEALETMQGKQTSEFYQQQLLFDKSLKQQEEEQRLHRQCAQKKIQAWERTLKQKYEAQIALNEEMETEVPRMTSEAEVEEKRQQAYHFS